jgi:hypothetical protein
MTVYLVVEWIDGIPETIKVYSNKDSAEQFVRIMGRRGLGVQEMEVFE